MPDNVKSDIFSTETDHRTAFALTLEKIADKLNSKLDKIPEILYSVLIWPCHTSTVPQIFSIKSTREINDFFTQNFKLIRETILTDGKKIGIFSVVSLQKKLSFLSSIPQLNSIFVFPISHKGSTAFVCLLSNFRYIKGDPLPAFLQPLHKEIISVPIRDVSAQNTLPDKSVLWAKDTIHRITQYLKIIRNINQLIVREKDKFRLLEKSCSLLEKNENVDFAAILETSSSGTIQEVYTRNVFLSAENLMQAQLMKRIRQIISSEKKFFYADDTFAQILGLSAKTTVIFPIRHKDYTLGLLLLGFKEQDALNSEEISLFVELASDLAYALHMFELEEENARIAQAIEFINQEIEGNNSEEILNSLITNIARSLSANLVFVGQLINEMGKRKIRTISVYHENKQPKNFEIDLEKSACFNVIEKGACVYGRELDMEFSGDRIFKMEEVQGYVGAPLKGVGGEVVGVLVALTKNQIANPRLMRKVIQVFAHRAEVELFRLKSEQKLKESEQRYRDIFQNSPFGIYRTTVDGKALIANPALLNLLGYASLDELKNKDIASHIYFDKKQRDEFLEKILKSDRYVMFDSVFKKKDGTAVYVRQRAMAVRDEQGNVKYIEGTVENITERKEQEEYIRYQNKLLEFASDAIIGTDGNYRIKFWNKSAEKLYGWKAEEVIGKKIDQVIQMDIPFEKRLEIRNIAKKRGRWRGEVVQYDRFGRKLNIEMSISDLRDEEGKVLASVGINRDISEKIKYEEALRTSEESYRGLFDSVMEAIYIQAPDGTFLDVNEGAVRMYGYSKNELIGKTPADVAAPGRNDLNKVLEQFKKALAGEPQQFEFWGRRANGEEFPKNVRLYKGKYFGQDVVIALAEDITEKKKLEEDKKNLERQVHQNQRLETIGTLAGGIAHDFNNILTPILGYAEMIKMALSNNPKLRNKADQIIKASLRARDLIQQILTFSRQIDQQVKPVYIQHIINEATHLLRASIPSTIKLKKEIDKSCMPVMADPAQLHQVLINLCTNAYQAMEETGGELFIGLKQVHVDNGMANIHPGLKPGIYNQLIVSDTGEGMEPWVLERIFEPFFTTKGVGKGTGLGLSVVHGIIKNYHGEITVYSEKNKGTVFHVYLPVADIKEIHEVERNENIPHGNEHILIVDDEPSVLELEQQMLHYFGYKTHGLVESNKVLDELMANPRKYQMLITDLTMPNLTGRELAARVRAQFPNLPIIMITGYSEELTDDIKEKYGIQAILMKPVVASELAKTVRQVLDFHKKYDI